LLSQDLQNRADDLLFRSAVVSVTLLRYVTEHIAKLPLSVINRVLDTHGASDVGCVGASRVSCGPGLVCADVMVMVVPLIENPPWTRRTAKVRGASSSSSFVHACVLHLC